MRTTSYINFKAEKQAICDKLGFKDYPSALINLYADCKSLIRAGKVFEITDGTVFYWLKKQGKKLNRPGGDRTKVHGSFRFKDELNCMCFGCRHLNSIILSENLAGKSVLYKCKKNNFK